MTISKLKKKLDRLFSIYVRTKDADELGMTTCYTCGVKKHYKEMHAGHFQSRRHICTRWHEQNVKVQCPRCNLFNQGEQYKFGIYLDEREGEGPAEQMRTLANGICKMNKQDYLDEIKRTTRLIDELD